MIVTFKRYAQIFQKGIRVFANIDISLQDVFPDKSAASESAS